MKIIERVPEIGEKQSKRGNELKAFWDSNAQACELELFAQSPATDLCEYRRLLKKMAERFPDEALTTRVLARKRKVYAIRTR